MSELRVQEIHNPNDQTGGIEIDNNDVVSINGQALPTAGAQGNRNLIINGAMEVAQRATEVESVNANDERCHTCDRFNFGINTLGTWTLSQEADSTAPGFANSFRARCTTANASPAAGANCFIRYKVEAVDCQRLLDTGTTTHPLRLSFWVRSNRTGDASVTLMQADNSFRMFSTSYNIEFANTWEPKVIEIPADTAAAFDNDNGEGLRIDWFLNSGSNFNSGSHSAEWVDNDNTARNATNLGVGQAVDDEFFLTGVQLEAGTNATEFEWRPYSTELALCQRYFYAIRSADSTNAVGVTSGAMWNSKTFIGVLPFPVTMRQPPVVGATGSNLQIFSSGTNIDGNGVSIQNTSINTTELVVTSASEQSNGDGAWIRMKSGATSTDVTFNAEL